MPSAGGQGVLYITATCGPSPRGHLLIPASLPTMTGKETWQHAHSSQGLCWRRNTSPLQRGTGHGAWEVVGGVFQPMQAGGQVLRLSKLLGSFIIPPPIHPQTPAEGFLCQVLSGAKGTERRTDGPLGEMVITWSCPWCKAQEWCRGHLPGPQGKYGLGGCLEEWGREAFWAGGSTGSTPLERVTAVNHKKRGWKGQWNHGPGGEYWVGSCASSSRGQDFQHG